MKIIRVYAYVHLQFCLNNYKMSDYQSSGVTNGGVQAPKTFVPYNPVTKSYQPFVPSTVPLNPPPNVGKQNDSKNE